MTPQELFDLLVLAVQRQIVARRAALEARASAHAADEELRAAEADVEARRLACNDEIDYVIGRRERPPAEIPQPSPPR